MSTPTVTWRYCPTCRHAINRHDPFGCSATGRRGACDCTLTDDWLAKLAGTTRPASTPPVTAARPAAGRLTRRQVDVLRLAAQGLDCDQIGAQLGLAPDSIQGRLGRAYRTLGARGCAHAVHLAHLAGYLGGER